MGAGAQHETRGVATTRSEALSAEALADALGRELVGEKSRAIRGVAAIDAAGPGDLAYVRDGSLRAALEVSEAGVVVLPSDMDAAGRTAILSPNPALDFARAVELVCPPERPAIGVDARAYVDADCEIDASACIGPGVSLGRAVRIGARTIIHPNVTLYPDVTIGEDCVLHAGAVVREGCVLGDRVIVQPGAVIGGDGFGHVLDATGALRRMPQVGRVILEDEVEIGANTTVDRATLSETVLRERVKLDNLIQIGHNSLLEEDVVIAAQSGVSGSVTIRRGTIIMAQAGIADHIEIGQRSFIGARAGVMRDIDDHVRAYGSPHMEERSWHRAMAALKRLPGLLRRMRAVERKLGLRTGSKGKDDGDATL